MRARSGGSPPAPRPAFARDAFESTVRSEAYKFSDIEKIKTSLASKGYAYFKTEEENLIGIGAQLGNFVADNRNKEIIRNIKPEIRSKASENTLSSRYGMGAFPFHTDCAHWEVPAKYLCLYCMNPGLSRRATFLIDTQKWIWEEDERISLINSVWTRALLKPKLCTLADESGKSLSIRYDMDCMKPVTEDAKQLLKLIQKKIDASATINIEWHVGEILILDNKRMLHARGPSSKMDSDRMLKRMLVGE